MSAWLDIAERAEAAAGPDRELDGDIHALAYGWEKRWNYELGFFQFWKDARWIALGSVPAYTASLDATMTLVPEGFDSIKFIQNAAGRWMVVLASDDGSFSSDLCANKALALVAASARAHHSREKGGGG